MLCVWGVIMFLLLVGGEAQSGDSDSEPELSCFSHVTMDNCSLTCRLEGGGGDREDDEDEGTDRIERIMICFTDWSRKPEQCIQGSGDTVSSKELSPLGDYNVTIYMKRGRQIKTTVELKKIVKPWSPHVFKVTFDPDSYQAVFHIKTPYQREYLKVENQMFQLLIWSAGRSMTQNVSSSDTLKIDMQHLTTSTQYHVRVRAIPLGHLQGTWSEWSNSFPFFTPDEQREDKQTNVLTLILTVCLVMLLLVTSCVVFICKNKISSYMWPSIPRPKHTLVHICRPNKGLLLNFKPEEFSALKVSPVVKSEEQPCEHADPPTPPAADSGSQSTPPCSTQTSECSTTITSISIEELSGLLSRSSSDEDDGVQSGGASSINFLQDEQRPYTPPPEHSEGGSEGEESRGSQQEEAYVTMSSFYQIK